MVTITKNSTRSNWVSGNLGDSFKFDAKVFEEPSVFGMSTPDFQDGNNVSILYITDNATGEQVYYFDRGHEEQDEERFGFDELAEIVMFLECKFSKKTR